MPAIQSFLVHALLNIEALGPLMRRSLAAATPQDLLLAGRAVFLVFSFFLAAVSFTRWRRAAERDTAHTAEQLTSVLGRLERLERLLAQNEPRLTALAEQMESHFESAAGAARENYPIAIRLARAGAEPAELMSNCGLTRQEAELVARLHGRRKDTRGSDHAALRDRAAAA
jgi:Protein of unknown function (DUF2802)